MADQKACSRFGCRASASAVVERHYPDGQVIPVTVCDQHKRAEFAPNRRRLQPSIAESRENSDGAR